MDNASKAKARARAAKMPHRGRRTSGEKVKNLQQAMQRMLEAKIKEAGGTPEDAVRLLDKMTGYR